MRLFANDCCAPDVLDEAPSDKYVSYVMKNHSGPGSAGLAASFTTPGRLCAEETSAGGDTGVVFSEFPVEFQGYVYKGSIAHPRGAKSVPLVLIYPNYAGRKQFDDDVAVFVAQLGYAGVVVDMYREDGPVPYPHRLRNPSPDSPPEDVAGHWAGAFSEYNTLLKNPKFWRSLQSAYLAAARKHPAVHQSHCAAIGYCFGGQCGLEMVRNGDSVQAVVSFHGVLQSHPFQEPIKLPNLVQTRVAHDKVASNRYNKKTRVVILTGELDHLAPPASQAELKEELETNGVKDWEIHCYGGTDHGFALPPGVLSNKFSPVADRRSTLTMLNAFDELWRDHGFPPRYSRVTVNAAGTQLFSSQDQNAKL